MSSCLVLPLPLPHPPPTTCCPFLPSSRPFRPIALPQNTPSHFPPSASPFLLLPPSICSPFPPSFYPCPLTTPFKYFFSFLSFVSSSSSYHPLSICPRCPVCFRTFFPTTLLSPPQVFVLVLLFRLVLFLFSHGNPKYTFSFRSLVSSFFSYHASPEYLLSSLCFASSFS